VSAAVLGLLSVAAAATSAALAVPARRGRPDPSSPTASEVRPPRATGVGLRVGVTLAAVVVVPALVGGAVGLLLAAVAGAVAWHLTGRLEPPAVRRRRERLVAAVPHVVDLLAACLAAGLSPTAALRRVAVAVDTPAREELQAVATRLDLGVDPVTVWRDLARHRELGGLGRCLARAVESGASVSEAMDRLAEDLRRSARAEVESRARAVGVQAAVPLGVCLLPAFVLVGVVPLVAGSLGVLGL
jgi:Flp pilus assembly protein TadB